MIFTVTLGAVGVLLLLAAVGYLLFKSKILGEDAIKSFSKILVYVCQPALAIYTFKSTEFSLQKLAEIGIFAALCVAINATVLTSAYFIYRKKSKENPIYRIMTIATTMSNCAFFGIPIIEAILPDTSDDLIIFTTVFSLVMNIIGWTVGSAIISGDTKYISVKKIFLNPAFLGFAAAMLLFVLEIPIDRAPTLFSALVATAKMATPISMMVMGMRLSTMKLSELWGDVRVYLTIFIKQMVFPLIAFVMVWLLPVSSDVARTFYIVCATPVASVVLNYSEIVGVGEKEAANTVLLGTMLSIITLPVMMLLLPLL